MIQSVQEAILAPSAYDAWEKWRYYVKASKEHPKERLYTQLRKVYNEVKNGKRVVDLRRVLEKSERPGMEYMPLVGIARIDTKVAHCFHHEDGSLEFKDNAKKYNYVFYFSKVFRSRDQGRHGWGKQATCPVPPMPHEIAIRTNSYKGSEWVILWEVKRWSNVLPADPYLLRRLTDTLYVIEGEWDLTEIERAVMQGNMHL